MTMIPHRHKHENEGMKKQYLYQLRVLFCVTAIFLTFFTSASVAQAQTTAVTNITGASTALNADFSLGWEFTPTSNLLVNQLGVFDENSNGLSSSHQVGIFRVSDQALVASTVVSTGNTLDSGFRYANITPTVLTSGQNYIVAALYTTAGVDRFMFDSTSFTTSSALTFVTPRFSNTSSFVFPTTSFPGPKGYFSANFKFAVAPEPGTLAFLMVGGVLAAIKRRRVA
jgi:hypothetical protein